MGGSASPANQLSTPPSREVARKDLEPKLWQRTASRAWRRSSGYWRCGPPTGAATRRCTGAAAARDCRILRRYIGVFLRNRFPYSSLHPPEGQECISQKVGFAIIIDFQSMPNGLDFISQKNTITSHTQPTTMSGFWGLQ